MTEKFRLVPSVAAVIRPMRKGSPNKPGDFDADALSGMIDKRLPAVGDADRRKISASHFPTTVEMVGVRTPDLRTIVKEVSKRALCSRREIPRPPCSHTRRPG